MDTASDEPLLSIQPKTSQSLPKYANGQNFVQQQKGWGGLERPSARSHDVDGGAEHRGAHHGAGHAARESRGRGVVAVADRGFGGRAGGLCEN